MYQNNVWSTSSRRLLNLKCQSSYIRARFNKYAAPKQTRYLSTNIPKPSSGGNVLYLGGTAGVLGLLGIGMTAYAKYDSGFRKNVENTVPLSKDLFTALYGEIQKKETLLPEEKDLSIPFVISPEKENLNEDVIIPIFADTVESKKSDNVIALNTFDSPSVSMIDLDISNQSTKPETTENVDAKSEILLLEKEVVEECPIPLENDSIEAITVKDEVATESQLETVVTMLDEGIEEPVALSLEEQPPALDAEEQTPALDDMGPLTRVEIENLVEILDSKGLEVILDTSAENIKLLSEQTVQSQQEAANSIHAYLLAFSQASLIGRDEESYEAAYKSVIELEHKSQESIDAAKLKETALKAELENVKLLTNSIRKSGESTGADKAESLVNYCQSDLDSALCDIEKANVEFEFILQYEKLIENAPEKLKKDLKEFTPDLVKLMQLKRDDIDIEKLSQEDAVLGFALKRVDLILSQLEEEKILSSKKVEEMLEKQKETLLQAAEGTLAAEIRRVETEKELEQKQKLEEAEVIHEKDLLNQLKRQAIAHSEHLSEELHSRSSALNAQHKEEMDSRLYAQQIEYQFNLEKNLAYLHGIHSKMTDVVDIEQRQRQAQELWIATQALNAAMKETLLHGRTRTLMPEMLAILHLGGKNQVLEEIVESVPKDAAMIGVIPEKDLIKRFSKVKQVCKKVAMVSDDGSLVSYAFSYLKSFFVLSKWYLSDVDSELDVDNLGTYEILSKAEYFILQGDLEQATKFMSQLKGVSRKLSADWLKEARLLLETRQTVQLLLAYASSLSAGIE